MTDQVGNSLPYDLSAIDQATLTTVVRKMLDSETVIISQWDYKRLSGGAGDVGDILSAVYRFTGRAQDQSRYIDWSLILKVVGTTAAEDDPTHSRWWQREILAYKSGHLVELPGGLTSPRFFGTHQFSEKIFGLWLEDIKNAVGLKWPLDHYGMVARHLGRFNGAYLTKRELPSWDWLSRDWLRSLVEQNAAPGVDRLRQSTDDIEVRQWYKDNDVHVPCDSGNNVCCTSMRLDRLPQTLLHRDAFRRNLFIRHDAEGEVQIVAVDWAYVGIGAIGEEIVSLVHGSLVFSEVAIAEASKLEQICFEGYLEGLADAGWQGDPRMVRLGYAIGAALCFGIGYTGMEPIPQAYFSWLEQAFEMPIDQFIALRVELKHHLLDLAEEAQALMQVL